MHMDLFQQEVVEWLIECFGVDTMTDVPNRNHRFLEEALELVQASECTRVEAHQLVDYVYDRPAGDLNQEVGGVMMTLAALCAVTTVNLNSAAKEELGRCWVMIDKIRAKNAAKHKDSALPGNPVA